MKKNFVLAISSYILVFAVILLSKTIKSLEIFNIILILTFACVSSAILLVDKPIFFQLPYIRSYEKNTILIKVIKLILFIYMVYKVISKVIVGIMGQALFFPWHPDKPITHYFIIYLMLIAGAITEELLFRYLIYQEILRKIIWKWFAIILTSIFFSLYHYNNSLLGFLVRFFMGIQFNLLYEFYPSILLVSSYHLFLNLLVFIY